eukprot:TRINITY_DN2870_c0_g1_i1.p1 TRINITY_DN2870_c0_g1~~TRINITY_DN2870_c0_g1_i1.p1  ORF type:complete len:275 (+),score=57.85 TRINITY_DN2870_c0_g1_i1:33-827(+)
MAVRGSMKCVKYSLFFGNLVILLVGGALLGFGIYAHIKGANVKSLEISASSDIAIGFMALGGVIMSLSFLGCCGSCSESRCILGIFFALLLLLLLGEIGAGVASYILRGKIDDQLTDAWKTASNTTKKDIQNDFECCGWDSVSEAVRPCTYSQTCHDQVESFLKKNLLYFGIAAIIAAVIQFIALFFSGCLICHLGRLQDDEMRERLLDESEQINREKNEKLRQESADRHAYYKQKYANYASTSYSTNTANTNNTGSYSTATRN